MFKHPLLSSFASRLRRSWLRLVTLLGIGSVVAATGCSQLALKERELVFRVVPGTAGWYGGLPEGVIESHLSVTNNDITERVHTWWWPAEKPDAPALLYLHGSRWNLTGHVFRIEQLRRDFGFSVLAVDYRGFGQSDGALPSEQTVYEDARVAWERLTQLQPDPAKRYIYGHSLGGAVAIDLAASLNAAAHQPPAAHGLIVESSFTNLADLARSLSYSWLPLQLILSQRFDSIEKIAQVRLPVLIVHGSEDRYVAAHFSQKLFDAAPGKKRLLLVEGANHNNSMRVGGAEYRQALHELFGWRPNPS